MTRKELAEKAFQIMKRESVGLRSEKALCRAIAGTDDSSLLSFVEKKQKGTSLYE